MRNGGEKKRLSVLEKGDQGCTRKGAGNVKQAGGNMALGHLAKSGKEMKGK